MIVADLEFRTDELHLRDFHLLGQMGNPTTMGLALIELMQRREITGNWTEYDIWEMNTAQMTELSKRLVDAIHASVPKKKTTWIDKLFGGTSDKPPSQ